MQIIFFEKPGCATNARQRRALQDAGHELVVRSILAEPWTAETLRPFLEHREVAHWFNPMAPRVKYEEVQPASLDAATALQLLLDDHLLIRRPLMQIDDGEMTTRLQGFDVALLQSLNVLPAPSTEVPALSRCAREDHAQPHCPAPST